MAYSVATCDDIYLLVVHDTRSLPCAEGVGFDDIAVVLYALLVLMIVWGEMRVHNADGAPVDTQPDADSTFVTLHRTQIKLINYVLIIEQ